MSIGITILIGQAIGQKQHEKIKIIISSALWLFLLLALGLMVVITLGANTLAKLMQAPLAAKPATISYLQISGLGAVFIVGYNLTGSICRGFGDSVTSLLTVACASLMFY